MFVGMLKGVAAVGITALVLTAAVYLLLVLGSRKAVKYYYG